MRRLPLVGALAAALLVVSALPGLAAPSNGGAIEFDLDCGDDGEITILVQFSTSSAAVFDGELESNGRSYVLSELDDRIYLGEFTTEPAGDPDFAFFKAWGKRTGYRHTITCEGSFVWFEPSIDSWVSEFFDVEAKAK